MLVPTIDFRVVDTTPGSGTLFSPPGDFTGGEKEYGQWLKQQFRKDIGSRQMLACYARFLGMFHAGGDPIQHGPYVAKLREFCKWINMYVKEETRRRELEQSRV